MTLKYVNHKLEEIKKHNGRLDKEKLISKFIDDVLFTKCVYYALHPFKQYNTTRVFYISGSNPESVNDIFNCLDKLSNQTGASDKDIEELSKLSSFDQETVEVVKKIITKDLDCGASIKTFKKFIPDLPEHEVMACEKDIDPFLKICNNDFRNVYYSTKIDGVRCTTVGNGVYLSRNGKEFPNFGVFDNDIKKLDNKLRELYPEINWGNVIFDGEGVIEVNDKAEFQDLMTEVKRLKNPDPSKFKYYIFDIIIDDKTFEERYSILYNAFNQLDLENVILLEHYILSGITSVDEIKQLANLKIQQGHEGLVLKNKSSYYERKRSRHWCKVKETQTYDVEVITWKYGAKKNSDKMGKLACKFKNGVTFSVGSGFTDKQRIDFMYDTPKIIEFECQGLTKDGEPRFPVFKRIRNDKDEVD